MALTYQAAVEQTITAGEQIHQIVNGTATTEVTVEDGSKVPSIRKALLDNFYFKDPIAWQVGQTENVFNQLRQFTDGSWWYAPSATASNPISMGSTPVGDSLWKIYDFDAIGKLTPQLREALRRSYAEAGYNLVSGSFEAGGTVSSVTDVLPFEADGHAYRWGGVLPKVVPPASSPATTGGIGSNGWLDIGDASLRSQFELNNGYELVGGLVNGFVRRVDGIEDLIAITSPALGDTVEVQSYHKAAYANVLDTSPAGGGQFRWSPTTPKNAHNGGYIIDPDKPFPPLSSFNTYYSSTSAGTGCWVRFSDRIEINTAEFGMLNSNDMVWNCAAFMAAFKFSMKKEAGQIPTKYKKLSIPSGIYKTTNPIIISDIDGHGVLPSVVGGDGSLGSVMFQKTTTNTTGPGYFAGDVDAVYMVSPTSSFKDYLLGEKIHGVTFDRDSSNSNVGYAYLARKSAMAQRGNLICRRSLYCFYAHDCWMSDYGEVWAMLGVNGISIISGTSCTGGTLFANKCSGAGFDFSELTYSHLMCACDFCGTGSEDGNIAYNFTRTKAVTGSFNTEYHKGTEFLFNNTEGAVISGRCFKATAVSNAATRILNPGGGVVKFVGYHWGEDSFSNLSPEDKAKYTFKSMSPLSSIAFDSCVPPPFPAEGFIKQLDDLTFPESISISNYSDCSGVINRLVKLDDTTYRRLGYIGDAVSIMLVSAICKSPGYATRTYEAIGSNALTNSRLIQKSNISTSSASPTTLYQLYDGGSPSTIGGQQFLVGYVDSDGWLWVKPPIPGNNLQYRFVIHK